MLGTLAEDLGRGRDPAERRLGAGDVDQGLILPLRQQPRVVPLQQIGAIRPKMRGPVERVATGGEGQRIFEAHVSRMGGSDRGFLMPESRVRGNASAPRGARAACEGRVDAGSPKGYMRPREVGAGERLANPVRSGRKQP